MFDYFGRQWRWFRQHVADLEKVGKDEYYAYVNHWAGYIHDLSNEQLRAGCEWVKIAAGNNYDVQPTLFRRHCFGLVDSDIAYEMAKDDEFAHPAIYFAVQKIGKYAWKSLPEQILRKRFLVNYAMGCDLIMGGGEIFMPDKNRMLSENLHGEVKKASTTEYGKQQAKALRELAEKAAAKMRVRYEKGV